MSVAKKEVFYWVLLFVLLLGPYILAQTPEFYYNESVAIQQTTSTGYVDGLVLTITPKGQDNFLILGSGEMQMESATLQEVSTQLEIDGFENDTSSYRPPNSDATTWFPFVFSKRINLDATPHTVKIRFKTSSTTKTAKVRNLHIAAWSVDSEYNESNEESIVSNIAINKTILTFTPSTGGDYLIISTAQFRGPSGDYVNLKLYINDVIYANSKKQSDAAGNSYYSFGTIKKINLGNSQQTIKLEFTDEGGPTNGFIKNARIAAVRLDQLGEFHYNESEDSSSTLSTSLVNKLLNTYVPNTGSYLVIGTTHLNHSVTNSAALLNISTDSVNLIGEVSWTPRDQREIISFFSLRNITAAQHTDKIQYATANSAHSTSVQYARLITIAMNDAIPNVTLNYPANKSFVNSIPVDFNFTVEDDTGISNCTLYGNFSGSWVANKTITTVDNGTINNITISPSDGIYIWNVLCYDNATNPRGDWYDYNYTVTIDTVFPILSNITEIVTTSTATINWTTDESANSSLNYGLTKNLGSNASDAPLVTSHSLEIIGLSSSVPYYYNITSCDSSNNCRTNGTFNFTTSAAGGSGESGGSGGGGGGGGGSRQGTLPNEVEQRSPPVFNIPFIPEEVEEESKEESFIGEQPEEQRGDVGLLQGILEGLKRAASITGGFITNVGAIGGSNVIVTVLVLLALLVFGVYEERKYLKKKKEKKITPKKNKLPRKNFIASLLGKRKNFEFKKREDIHKDLEKAGFSVKKSTKSSELMNVLQELRKIGNIDGSCAISRDGLIIASNIPTKTGAEKFSANSALMVKSVETALKKLNKGTLNHIILNTKTRKVLATTAGNKAILVCLIKQRGNLGLMLIEIRKTANEVAKILE